MSSTSQTQNVLVLKKDFEGSTIISVFDRGEWSGTRLLSHLGLDRQNRYVKGFRESEYIASGLWTSYRSDAGTHMYSVDVGCCHDWDCCGCLCQLSFEIALMQGYFIVKTNKVYNH